MTTTTALRALRDEAEWMTTTMRTAAKVDANQPEIVMALRAAGAMVAHTHQIGGGFPDLVVSYYDRTTGKPETVLMEVKDGSKSYSAQRLTFDEETFHDRWIGRLVVVRTVDEALRAIGAQA
jgi:hypothetical protein